MKKILLILIPVFMLFAFDTQAQSKIKTKEKSKNGQKVGNQTIAIKTSAQCDMCKDRIEKALALEKGIKKAVLDVDTKVLNVTYNSTKINADQIRQKVATVGYDADEVKADTKAYQALPGCCQKGGH